MNTLMIRKTSGQHGFVSNLLPLVFVIAMALMVPRPVFAQNQFKMIRRAHGGLVPSPDITSVSKTTNNQMSVKWNGFTGPFQLMRSTSPLGPWEKLGAPGTNKSVLLPFDGDYTFFRVNAPAQNYAGSDVCMDCHSDRHSEWLTTRHASSFETLRTIKQDKNAACVGCHSVGFGVPGGFVNEALTPNLVGVQCESCHGPAGDHANRPNDKNIRPVKEVSSLVCGGCHSEAHHPTFEEWNTAGHGSVTPTTANYFRTVGQARMQSCGACHSGAVRLAMLSARDKGTAVSYPTNEVAATTPVTCVVCHDSHKQTANGSQLRNPTKSLTPFSYSTSTNTSFTLQYDPNVNMCGQCHNLRGGVWTDTGRSPHYSPQYNMLIGNGGVEVGTAPQSKHRDNLKQCAQCHTHQHPVENPTENEPNFTGHTFEPLIENCYDCHDKTLIAGQKAAMQSEITNSIASVRALLDQWATTKANEALRTKYGKLAWEFSSPGLMNNPNEDPKIVGPTASEQTVVPDDIKKARFNLYMVYQDKSKGIHNAQYAKFLLKVATDKVNAQLTAP